MQCCYFFTGHTHFCACTCFVDTCLFYGFYVSYFVFLCCVFRYVLTAGSVFFKYMIIAVLFEIVLFDFSCAKNEAKNGHQQ